MTSLVHLGMPSNGWPLCGKWWISERKRDKCLTTDFFAVTCNHCVKAFDENVGWDAFTIIMDAQIRKENGGK